MIGSTDSHTGLATAQEDNFFGKHSGAEPKPGRMTHPFMSNEKGTIMGWAQVSSGLAAVWAPERRGSRSHFMRGTNYQGLRVKGFVSSITSLVSRFRLATRTNWSAQSSMMLWA